MMLTFSSKISRIIYSALIIFITGSCTSLGVRSATEPARLTLDAAATLNRQYPVIFLIRHGERCDRSENKCLSEAAGITRAGAKRAGQYGANFSKTFASFSLYSSNTVRTVQSATAFSGRGPAISTGLGKCDKSIYGTIRKLAAGNKTTVLFTHNHCLSFIAKDMNKWQTDPGYLDTLVMHEKNDRLYLDGELVSPQ
ncbi:lipopolysaccharide core heptose(II)-phosphate phosphatase [Enterobacteriaceae bacterium H11S18]|uniref:lipopolysaccharide core heptose(II)-phosphate phosphatase n=1 Tax=Dryocola clanedunensis TaxID=2925396 RepID=UPI0022F08579|nr:lipopolysaccharide core heptose(II)-phosphate phosphatase [Dryocola clanedunensis]MCT4712974.1 lipopolysaccharide core heptose(II)-phosphate phosphatase [Dryocola clanedunensis]